MAVSKVILNQVTLMDVTQDTVASGNLLYGETATKNDGTGVTGTIAAKSSSDVTLSNMTVSVPLGYYASNVSMVLTGVTVPIPSSGTNTFAITVPNGANDTVTFTFTVDSNGNTEIT